MQDPRHARLMRLGFIIFVIGTISNIAEYALAVSGLQGVVFPIAILALVDATFIAYVFMHVTQLWRPEE